MSETEGAFRLTFVQGRGLLSLSGRDFEGLGHVDALELEIPNLRFPFDMSGGVARFKNRRLRLRELALAMGSDELTGLLARAPLGDFGIFDPRVTVDGSRLTLTVRVRLGGREVELVASAVVSPLPPRGASLCICDVRAYGFLPVPAPLVVTALFSALGAETPANRDSTPELALPPLLHIRTAADVRIDACELVMLAMLPMYGWRMPERSQVQIRVAGGVAKSNHVPLVFSLAEGDAGSDPLLDQDANPDAYATREFAARCAPVEDALARGDIATAASQLRALAPLENEDRVGTVRLLQLLLAGHDTLGEAEEMAQAALSRWPELLSGTLALAVVAAERGQAAEAAAFYEELAQHAMAQGHQEDASAALLAAARQLAASGEDEQALLALERALALRPGLRPIARAKVKKRAAEGGFPDILAILGEESSLAQPDADDEVAQVLNLVYEGQRERDPVVLTQAIAFLEPLLQREVWPEDSSCPRAEAAYQLALAYVTLEDDEVAARWLAAVIEGEASGVVVASAWQSLAELMLRRGDAGGAVQTLMGWAADERVPEDAGTRIRHLLDAAELTRASLQAPDQALAILDHALALSPVDRDVLAMLERLGSYDRVTDAVVATLRRELGQLRPDQGKDVLRTLVRVLVDNARFRADAKAACGVLLGLAPDDGEALVYLARMAWEGGDRTGYAAIDPDDATLPRALQAELHLRQAQVVRMQGKPDEARPHLDRGLAFEPDGAAIEIVAEALGELGLEGKLAEIIATREAAVSDEIDRWQTRRRLAGVAERMGDFAQAEARYREMLEASPDDVELLDRMASLCRRQGRRDEQAHWLGRLWEVVERDAEASSAVDAMAVGMDLATLLVREPAGMARAESVLRRLLERSPDAVPVLEALDRLLVERGSYEEAGKMFARRLGLAQADEAAALLIGRARACAERPQGLRPALAVLQTLEPEELDEEALTMRAALAEQAGDPRDAAHSLGRLRLRAGDEARVNLTKRLAELLSQPRLPAAESIRSLEQLLAEEPDNLFVAKALFEAYGRLDEAEQRTRCWQELLLKEPALPDSYRARLHMALAETAERAGDLAAAEELIDKAGAFDHAPKARADQLLAQARLALARDNTAQAEAKVAEALNQNPEAAGGLALVAELAYRGQEWEKAREAYRKLAELPAPLRGVSLDVLACRRAELAEMFGDQAEAEAAYRSVVSAEPANYTAREALARFALLRGELAEAAMHLQEVVRALPKDAVAELTQIRQRLGQVYLGLGDLQAARQNLELTLAGEPDRAATLELLATTYVRLGLHRDAAAMCERLSRVLDDPGKKAEALYREGEILRTSLADPEGASEAYLRASDLDPSFAPPLARLVTYYWSRGDLVKLADVGGDLVQASSVKKPDENDLGVMVMVAALLGHRDEALAKLALETSVLGAPIAAQAAAERIGDVAARVARGSLEALDAVLEFLLSAMSPDFEAELVTALGQGLANDPGDAGQAMALGRLYERRGAKVHARSAYSLAQVADPGLGADERLALLGELSPPLPAAYGPGTAVHPACRGPLRRVLQNLAAALASAGPSVHDEPSGPLSPDTVALCESLRVPMAAPPIPLVAQGHGADVTFSASQPLCILIGGRAEALPPADLRFLLGRALEQARAGTLAVLRMSVDNLRGMLRAVLRVAGAPGTPFELAEEAADEATALWLSRLRRPEIAALIPLDRLRGELLADAAAALVNPPDLDEYIRGCRYTADRVGLLLCGRPLTALRALAGLLKDSGGDDATTAGPRREQMRASQAMRELVAFMLSDEYAALVEA